MTIYEDDAPSELKIYFIRRTPLIIRRLSCLETLFGTCPVRRRVLSVAPVDTPDHVASSTFPSWKNYRPLTGCGRIDVFGGVVTLMILAYVTFGLRVWVRHGKTWASEDWVMTFATVSYVTAGGNS